jgi:hypothetical protein
MTTTTNSGFDPNDQGIDMLKTSVSGTTASVNYTTVPYNYGYYWWDNHHHYPYGWYGGGVCPTCGHCPTCGRGGHAHGAYPYYPNYPYYTPIYWNISPAVNAAAGSGNQIYSYKINI